MSFFARFAVFAILIPAGVAYSLPIIAQSAETKSQVPAQTKVDGKFARYLESLGGDIDGMVLEDGTIARFVPFKRATQVTLFRPGDSVRVEGDVVSGVEGPYLVHALVTRIDVPTTRGAVSPTPPAGSAGNSSRSRRAGKGPRNSPQPPRVAGKPTVSATDRSGRADNLLVVDRSSARARKKGSLETMESKARDATTGKSKGGNYSQWSRTQETAGP
jgi:hypothetical protein